MSTLDERIRRLAPPAEPLTPVDDLRRRVGMRRTRRRVLAGVAILMAVVAAVSVATRPGGHDPESVVAGPSETVPDAPITFGGVTGVRVTVTPASDLVDGQEVEVRVEGLDQLTGAQLAMCRGDLTEPVGLDDCDLGALALSRPVADEQVVEVSAALTLSGRAEPYDCASEPAGCVLAVGTVAPSPAGVAVPVHFRPGTAPTRGDEAIAVDPLVGLEQGRAVTVTATGLDPNRSYRVVQCAPAAEDPSVCAFADDAYGTSPVVADQDGRITTTAAIRTEVWSAWDGVVDCTQRECRLQMIDDRSRPVALTPPLGFAPGAVATAPRLVIEPDGPYVDGQEVLVRGTGFVPGTVASGRVGQCPAGLDPRKEERCQYSGAFAGIVVSPEGTFEMVVVVRESLLFTGSCRDGAGCVVGWVINHGPLVAPVPLAFE